MNRDITKVDCIVLTKEEWKKLEKEFNKKPITKENNKCLEEIVEIYELKHFNY